MDLGMKPSDIHVTGRLSCFKDVNAFEVINLGCYKSQPTREYAGLFWKAKFKGNYSFNLFQKYTF